MMARSPGRRFYEVKWMSWAGGIIGGIALLSSLWFLHGSYLRVKTYVHNPHYDMAHCYDCHERFGSKMKATDCFECHDSRTRQMLPGAEERRKKISERPCRHPLKAFESDRTVTKLCLSCHTKVSGYVAMLDITSKRYVEIDMAITHPIGLLPTETIFPRTLPLDKSSGAINCITCHDPHATDKRLRMLRYYYPGNGRPADFRPLCLDCHLDGDWIPLRLDLKKSAIKHGNHEE